MNVEAARDAAVRRNRLHTDRLLIVAVLVLTALAAVDWWMRTREIDTLLTAIEANEQALESGYDTIAATADRLVDDDGALGSQEIAGLQRDLPPLIQRYAADVYTTRDQVEEVAVLPWHRSIRKAHARYLDHAETWVDWYERAVKDYRQIGTPSPEITSTFRTAERAMRAALPPGAPSDLERRISDVFRE